MTDACADTLEYCEKHFLGVVGNKISVQKKMLLVLTDLAGGCYNKLPEDDPGQSRI